MKGTKSDQTYTMKKSKNAKNNPKPNASTSSADEPTNEQIAALPTSHPHETYMRPPNHPGAKAEVSHSPSFCPLYWGLSIWALPPGAGARIMVPVMANSV